LSSQAPLCRRPASKQPELTGEEWRLAFKHISKGRATITAQDLIKVSEELGHPGGDMDGDMACMMLKRAAELTGSGSSHIRPEQFLALGDIMFGSG